METDELRGIADDARAQLLRARRMWLRRYVRSRVDESIELCELERALSELRSNPEDPGSRRPAK